MILFLDFDGVLHPEGEGHLPNDGTDFCFLPRLEELLREFPHVRIVISSSWRERLAYPTLLKPFSEDIRARIIGTTPPRKFALSALGPRSHTSAVRLSSPFLPSCEQSARLRELERQDREQGVRSWSGYRCASSCRERQLVKLLILFDLHTELETFELSELGDTVHGGRFCWLRAAR